MILFFTYWSLFLQQIQQHSSTDARFGKGVGEGEVMEGSLGEVACDLVLLCKIRFVRFGFDEMA